eukprot:UN25052
MYRLGANVYAGCLEEKSIKDYKKFNTNKRNNFIRGVKCDVTKHWILNIYDQVQNDDPKNFWAIINNAGISSFGWSEYIDIDTYKFIGDVNVYGTIRVCKTFLPLIRKNKGRIINIGSIGPRMNAAFGSAYLNSKAAMMSYTSSLAQEVRKFGVNVSCIEPGFLKQI